MCTGLFSVLFYLVKIIILGPEIKIPDSATGKAHITQKTPQQSVPFLKEDLIAGLFSEAHTSLLPL